MRPMLALFACILIGLVANPADAWYPTTVLEEMGTSVTCGYCPLAYEGIEHNQEWYDTTEFEAVRYYGAPMFNGPAMQDRIDYYPLTPYPTAMFMGETIFLGTNDDTASGLPYQAAIQDYLGQPSYFKMTINSFDLVGPDGLIDLDIEVMEDAPNISDVDVQILVVENGVFYGHDHNDLVRDVLTTTPVTISSLGQTQNISFPFTIDAEWVDANLRLVAFIQDNTTRKIHNSVSTLPKPEYAMGYYSLGDHQTVKPLYGQMLYDSFTVHNTGTVTDTYTFELVVTGGKEDWYFSICDDSSCYVEPHSFDLAPGEHLEFHVDVTSLTSGYSQFAVKLTQAGWPAEKYRMIHYGYTTDDIEVLLVNSDKEEVYSDYFTDALEVYDIHFGVWNARWDEPPALLDALSTPIVVWNNGQNRSGFSATERAFITNYLDAGGNVMMSGQNLGEEMDDLGGEAYTWYQNYMHAEFIDDSTEDTTIEGVDLDPVSSELNLTLAGGDGADNQTSLDEIAAADGTASIIWTYDTGSNAALRAATGSHRLVYLAFGLEGIDNELDRRLVMFRAINWLRLGDMAVDTFDRFTTGLSLAGLTRPNSLIQFTLPTNGAARLSVYGLDGRLIRTLADDTYTAGTHTTQWDRMDNSGTVAPAGVYYYRLDANGESCVRKAVLLK